MCTRDGGLLIRKPFISNININININICFMDMAKKLKYDTTTRWRGYKQQCEISVIYSAYKLEQNDDYCFISKITEKYWHEWNEGEW